MNKFIKRFLLFLFPLLLLCTIVTVWDPFRVFWQYDEYYQNNVITGNREDVCLKLFKKHKDKTALNSFIIGSSRSQAFKAESWKNYLNDSYTAGADTPKCFHFDGSSLGLYRAHNIIQYLDKSGCKLNNVLLIVDANFFKEVENPSEPLFVQPYEISGGSAIPYYFKFLKASLDAKFLFNFLVYKITGKHYKFMGNTINRSTNFHRLNPETCDLYYYYDEDIKQDSIGYYQKLIARKVFIRKDTAGMEPRVIHTKQRELLNKINDIVAKHKTNIKVVISPVYDQKIFHPEDKHALVGIFSEHSVYDFSGVNSYTSEIKNYYEASHYKPMVANDIMKTIYRRANVQDTLSLAMTD